MIDPVATMRPVFSRSDYDKIKDLQRRIAEIIPLLEKAEACGSDCRAMRDYITSRHQQLIDLEREWLTPPPSA